LVPNSIFLLHLFLISNLTSPWLLTKSEHIGYVLPALYFPVPTNPLHTTGRAEQKSRCTHEPLGALGNTQTWNQCVWEGTQVLHLDNCRCCWCFWVLNSMDAGHRKISDTRAEVPHGLGHPLACVGKMADPLASTWSNANEF
jgi:hypothetical protein